MGSCCSTREKQEVEVLIAGVDENVVELAERIDAIYSVVEKLITSFEARDSQIGYPEMFGPLLLKLNDKLLEILKTIEEGNSCNSVQVKKYKDTVERFRKNTGIKFKNCPALKSKSYLKEKCDESNSPATKTLSERLAVRTLQICLERLVDSEKSYLNYIKKHEKHCMHIPEAAGAVERECVPLLVTNTQLLQTSTSPNVETNKTESILLHTPSSEIVEADKEMSIKQDFEHQLNEQEEKLIKELKDEIEDLRKQVEDLTKDNKILKTHKEVGAVYHDKEIGTVRQRAEEAEKTAESEHKLYILLQEETDALKVKLQEKTDENDALKIVLEEMTKKKPLLVQIFSKQTGELVHGIENKLIELLASKRHQLSRPSEVDFVICSDVTQLSVEGMVLVVCFHSSRIGTAALEALQGINQTSKVALLVFHIKDEHALPSQRSDRVLTLHSVGGIFDLAFTPERGIYQGEMNENSIKSLMELIEENMNSHEGTK